eukprot:1960872-Pleurochrysis_carterae.AAC.1
MHLVLLPAQLLSSQRWASEGYRQSDKYVRWLRFSNMCDAKLRLVMINATVLIVEDRANVSSELQHSQSHGQSRSTAAWRHARRK